MPAQHSIVGLISSISSSNSKAAVRRIGRNSQFLVVSEGIARGFSPTGTTDVAKLAKRTLQAEPAVSEGRRHARYSQAETEGFEWI